MSRAIHAWLQVHLGAHVDLLTGYPFKSAQYTDTPDDIMLLRGDNVAQGSLRWERAKRWPIGQTAEFEKYRLRAGDVILAMDRPWIPAGLKYAWIKRADRPSLLVQRVARMRGTNGLSTDYLRYLIGSPQFTDHVMSIITGVNVPHISARDIKAFRFRLPPVENQRRIAAILSAYDDLIGNNTRRIAILEEMARRLYEEWFVHFRFPGHEGVKLVESEIGPVPEGWEISRLAELAEIVMGQSPKSEFYNETGEGLPFHQGVTNFGDFFPTDRLYCTVENRIAESGDILFSVRAPVGRINIATRKMVIGRGLSAIRSKSSHQTFLLCQLRSKFSEEDMMGGGTIFKAVTKKDMHDVQMVTPRDDHVGRFEGIAVPMWSLIKTLTEKNTNLRVQRALLLPKLISGEIDVCGIGEPIAEVAAE